MIQIVTSCSITASYSTVDTWQCYMRYIVLFQPLILPHKILYIYIKNFAWENQRHFSYETVIEQEVMIYTIQVLLTI